MWRNIADIAGRILLGILFFNAGMGKLGSGYESTASYMRAMDISPALLPLVIFTEVVFAMAVVLGFQTRIAAFLLAGFAVLTALFFHTDFSDPVQGIQFMKNLAIAGGLLALTAHGAGAWSLDAIWQDYKQKSRQ